MSSKRILLAGESWIMHTIHQKGFDSFTTTSYGEGHQWLSAALTGAGYTVEHLPNHLASDRFPYTAAELAAYDAVLLSDIGANTLLLSNDTFTKSIAKPNRLESLRQYTQEGGGLVMIGGYLTFQGIDARGKWAGTPVEDALPVTMQRDDDRVECPQGVTPVVADAAHPIVAGLPAQWPHLLGYNRLVARAGAQVVARAGDDPLLVAGTFGEGRTVAYASDCGPHWAPPAFCEWDGYARLWGQMLAWVSRR
jgi:uncharacterized membrane protein